MARGIWRGVRRIVRIMAARAGEREADVMMLA